MYNTSFFQIAILILLIFFLFGDINKIKENTLNLYKSISKK
jgi:hypothetical protein